MIKEMDGACYREALTGGIRNLDKYRATLNDLNVFPVPDGDTGTNMVMTLKCGLEAVKDVQGTLSEISAAFASAAVFGARGNSGVIISQFFKGMAESFQGVQAADAALLSRAVENGCKRAYSAVSKPVEGTMLTVLKDASGALAASLPVEHVETAIEFFLAEAQASLARTPDLLPILKKAGVVDSGGSGVCYLFEGVLRCLCGENIQVEEETEKMAVRDFGIFNIHTKFEYGYCVEGLIQLNRDPRRLNLGAFREDMATVSDSIVLSLETDKLKLHAHTKQLGEVMKLCQKIGEFLTVKIDNMTVQSLQHSKKTAAVQKFLCREVDADEDCGFAIVAVATTPKLQKMFSEMGADVVILSEIAPSSQDFLDAFKYTDKKDILVFPNSANSILSSVQASGLYKDARVHVLNSRSAAECHSALSLMDFSASCEAALNGAKNAITNAFEVGIYHATKNMTFGKTEISKNDFFSIANDKIISLGVSLDMVTLETVKRALLNDAYSIVTVFYGENIAEEYVTSLLEKIQEIASDVEIVAIGTDESAYSLVMTFE